MHIISVTDFPVFCSNSARKCVILPAECLPQKSLILLEILPAEFIKSTHSYKTTRTGKCFKTCAYSTFVNDDFIQLDQPIYGILRLTESHDPLKAAPSQSSNSKKVLNQTVTRVITFGTLQNCFP